MRITEIVAIVLISYIFGIFTGWFATMYSYESYSYNIPISKIKGQYLQLPDGTLWKKQ
mgnify:CR=1 FL=1